MANENSATGGLNAGDRNRAYGGGFSGGGMRGGGSHGFDARSIFMGNQMFGGGGPGGNPSPYHNYLKQQQMMQKMMRPQPQQQVQPPMPPRPNSAAPQMFMGTGGQYGYGMMRPGYTFFGPGQI